MWMAGPWCQGAPATGYRRLTTVATRTTKHIRLHADTPRAGVAMAVRITQAGNGAGGSRQNETKDGAEGDWATCVASETRAHCSHPTTAWNSSTP